MQGLIIENASNLYKVKVIEKVYTCTARGKMKQDDLQPVVGDFAEIEVLDEDKMEGVIEKVTHRKTYIKRPKLANISQIVIVVSMKSPEPDLLLLDKQLAFARYANINVVIVLNKIDLDTEKNYMKIAELYRKIGYKVFETNAKTGLGIDDLKMTLQNNKNAFAGNSGVGKSTIINKICNKEVSIEGEISDKSQRGKNTTTVSRLFEINTGTYIADTPGFSTFDISEIHSTDLDIYFREFRNFTGNCKYGNCSHIKEIVCGVKDALEEGHISKQRYDNYVKIYNELKEKEEHEW